MSEGGGRNIAGDHPELSGSPWTSTKNKDMRNDEPEKSFSKDKPFF
jgi:hypothetical protein